MPELAITDVDDCGSGVGSGGRWSQSERAIWVSVKVKKGILYINVY